MTDIEQTAVWEQHAEQWSKVQAPLKPSPDDGSLTLSGLKPIFDKYPDQCRVAVLGVTPELIQLAWPASVALYAYDHSSEMIASVWSSHPTVSSEVKQASWEHLPVEAGAFHAAVGDGSLNALSKLENYAEVVQELHRVIAPNGLMVIRCFIRPDNAETTQQIISAVHTGQVGSFHALKWRLAMALVNASSASVAVSDIHKLFEASFPSRSRLAALTGWHETQINTIDAYKNAATRYTFPRLHEAIEQLAPYFSVSDISYGTYELAKRCPTLTLKRQSINTFGL